MKKKLVSFSSKPFIVCLPTYLGTYSHKTKRLHTYTHTHRVNIQAERFISFPKTMYPYPEHFIIRYPGGRIVPVIAVDQLPDWIQLAGVPREIDAQRAVGMTSLGSSIVKDNNNGGNEGVIEPYEVHLRVDRIRAILSGRNDEEDQKRVGANSGSSSSVQRGYAVEDSKGKGKGLGDVAMPDVRINAVRKSSTKDNSEPQNENHATKASIIDCDSSNDSGIVSPVLSIPGRIEQGAPAEAQVQHPKNTKNQESLQKQTLPNTEPMLSASRHSNSPLESSGAMNTRERQQPHVQQIPIRPQMTEEMLRGREKYHQHQHPHPHQQQHVTRRIMRENTPNSHHHHQQFGVHGGNPDTLFCRHWCHHGTCKWGWECRYQHRMPMDVKGLREVGLRDFPTWYLLLMGGGGGGSVPQLPAVASTSTPLSTSTAIFSGKSSGFVLEKDETGRPVQRHPVDGDHFEGLGSVGSTSPAHATTHQHQFSKPYQRHHPSDIELRLMEGRMSALLSGSTTMSNRQKLKRIREMRTLFLYSSSSPSTSLLATDNNSNNYDLTDLVIPNAEHPHHRNHDHKQLPRPYHHHSHSPSHTNLHNNHNVNMTVDTPSLSTASAGTIRQGVGRPSSSASPGFGHKEGMEVGRLTPVSSDEDLSEAALERDTKLREEKLVDVD